MFEVEEHLHRPLGEIIKKNLNCGPRRDLPEFLRLRGAAFKVTGKRVGLTAPEESDGLLRETFLSPIHYPILQVHLNVLIYKRVSVTFISPAAGEIRA